MIVPLCGEVKKMKKVSILEKLSMVSLPVKVSVAAVAIAGVSTVAVISLQKQSSSLPTDSELSAITKFEDNKKDENTEVVDNVKEEPQPMEQEQPVVEEVKNDPSPENSSNNSQPETNHENPLQSDSQIQSDTQEEQAVSLPKPTVPEKDETEEYVPPKPEEIPEYLIGNSGKVFATLEEAREWATAEVDNPDSQWYRCRPLYRTVSLGPISTEADPWTVEF